MPVRIDATDRKILAALQRDASRSLDDIATEFGSSKTPVWNRIRKRYGPIDFWEGVKGSSQIRRR